MGRTFIRATALVTCALVATGCASMNFGSGSSKTASAPVPAATEAKDVNGLSSDLDSQIRNAQLLRAQGNLKGAIHVLSQLMLFAPDDPRIVGEYGKALAQEGRPNDALAFLGRAVELQPDNWSFYSAEGVAYDQLEQRDRAENAYQHALLLKPEDPVVLNNYAMSQMMAGNLDKAENLLNRAASHGGDYPKIANNLAMVTALRAKRMGPESSVKTPMSNVAQAKTPSGTKTPARVAAKKETAPAPAPAKPVTVAAMAKVQAAPKPAAGNEPVKSTSTGPRQLTHPVQAKAQTQKPAPRVVMQKVPYDPLAGKVYATKTAQAKTSNPRVVMQKVPYDPLAGKVYATRTAKAKPQHVAEAKKADDKAPMLRTAADLY